MREYVAALRAGGASAGVQVVTRSAIKSYFTVHDMALPKSKKRSEPVFDDLPMTLKNFYRIVQNGEPSITMRTIILITFQSGMDAATLADKFNHDGYYQIVKYFKTEDSQVMESYTVSRAHQTRHDQDRRAVYNVSGP